MKFIITISFNIQLEPGVHYE